MSRRRGGPWVTERDIRALVWLGEQFGAPADVLRVLLGLLSPAAPREVRHLQVAADRWAAVPVIDPRTLRVHLDRWERARLITRQRLLGQLWVTPTQTGLDLANLPYRPWPLPATRLAHVRAVGMLRLAFSLWWPQATWESERSWRHRLHQGEGAHVPDGFLTAPEVERAIEVELTLKSKARFDRAVKDGLLSLHGPAAEIWYYAPPTVAHQLHGYLRELGPFRRPVRVYELPALPGIGYGGAA